MNENEVKELISEEVERRVNEELAGASLQIEKNARNVGFSAGMFGFLACSVLTGIVLILLEVFVQGPIDKYVLRQMASENQSGVSLDEGVLPVEPFRDLPKDSPKSATSDDYESKKTIGDSYQITIDGNWRVYVSEHDAWYAVYLYDYYGDDKNMICLSKYNDETYSNVCYEIEIRNENSSRTHEEFVSAHEAEEEDSVVNFVHVGNHKFPVSDSQLELLSRFLKVDPTST